MVNWNSGEMSLKAISPYLNSNSLTMSCRVIVVDNASIDTSVELLRPYVDMLIANDNNIGFGKACNQALKNSDADYILLLNPDTVSEINVLEGLIEFLNDNESYGITGPAQLQITGSVLKSCARFPTFLSTIYEILGLSKLLPRLFTPSPQMTDWDHLESKDVDHVMGSYMVIRKKFLNKTGFFDEDFFMYMEDLDLSKRFALLGYKTFYNNNWTIIHDNGTSGNKIKVNRIFYALSSRRKYWNKHFNNFSYCVLIILSILVEPFLRIIDSLIHTTKPSIKTIVIAYYKYLKEIIA